ncbi:MAG: pyridoxal-5'-phosphate-dependent protein subunit beta [bacterium]|nr:pyridoxal-5'-phosphate-dependent protein subunit beta [bacterium]
MVRLGLEKDVVDEASYAKAVEHVREAGIVLPTLAQLADPARIPDAVTSALADIGPDEPNPLNLFRVHWFNAADRTTRLAVPDHVVLTEELTGVRAPILVALGDRFPMIRAHKVLAAYGCLAPRLVTGQFDPTRNRAIWPSTGNYCRGGIAISRILGCHGVAVLPEGMSAERFRWLDEWVLDPADIVRTPGSESNVREIYEACEALEKDPLNVVLNQFCEFGNHLVHWLCTGPALGRVFDHVAAQRPGLELFAFTSATGSAGTIGAGDYLKDNYGARIVAAEALECPTLLYNGYGEHNIQGIGDKHVPLIHNVTNTDYVSGVSDTSTDSLNVLFNTDVGRAYLTRERGVAPELVRRMVDFGLSSLCNVLAAIQVAKREDLGPDQALITVATDGAGLYETELEKALAKLFPGGFDASTVARTFEDKMLAQDDEHLLALSARDRDRVFNLGYFTWVEQRGVSIEEFEARRSQDFWRGLRELVPAWDARIDAFNAETAAAARG